MSPTLISDLLWTIALASSSIMSHPEKSKLPVVVRFFTVMYLMLPLPSTKLSRGFKPVDIFATQSLTVPMLQSCGISHFNCSFHTIAPPEARYGLPFSSGKSNCVNQ